MFVSETAKEPDLRAVIGAIDADCDVAAFLLGGGLRLFVGGGLRLLWCSVLDEAADAPGRGDSKTGCAVSSCTGAKWWIRSTGREARVCVIFFFIYSSFTP